ncbi:response regulator [Sphingomonas sanxanigenens]|uniref:response regulator n=1 Tax=Sphingomonas sanxanigenens TaxID=397260 RepID=UPI00046D968B|nr:response regulator [Sphingomonas sanxanigenens]
MASVPTAPEPGTLQFGRVLVIDDDPAMREMIATFLSRHNASAVGLGDPDHVVQQIDGGGFNLVILDVQLGDKDGFDVLRRIRERSDIPVIIITGQRQDEIDRIIGLELGADDYLTKPFSLHELLARARATLRRQEVGRQSQRLPVQRGGYRFNGWTVHRKTRSLTDAAGQDVPLTKGEYALLVAFLDAPNRVLSREHLLQATRTHEDIYDRSIDVQVLRLRRKLERDPANPALIRTERGVGYIFDAVVEQFF